MRQALQMALEALKLSVDALNNQDFDTGICCCGDSVEAHNIGSGHAPVDQGDYYVDGVVGCINTAIAEVEAALAEQRLQAADKVASSEVATLEPVAFVADVYQSRYTLEWNNKGSLPEGTPLYAAAQQRKPLSDEEMQSVLDEWNSEFKDRFLLPYRLIRLTEKAHGIGEQA